MASNKKFRIQNGANIEGELSFNNQAVINADGTVVDSAVQPAVESLVNTAFVSGLNVTSADAVSAQTVATIDGFSTSDLSEGSNLYFTPQRARDALQGGEGVLFNSSTGEFSIELQAGDGIAVSGNTVSLDGTSIAQDLVPAEDDVYSLGTPDKVWRDVYIGPGSLYINGTKILEDNSGTITMNADPGQNLSFGVTAGGSISFNAGDATLDVKSDMVLLAGKTITTTGGAATVFGGDVDLSGNNLCDIASPNLPSDAANKAYVDGKISDAHDGDKEFNDNVIVHGDLTVEGTTTTVNSETLNVADNIIDVNSNVTSGIPTENAGMRVMRGDAPAAQMRWNEFDDQWETFNGSAWTKVALSTSDLVEGDNKYFTEGRVGAIVNPIKTGLENADSDEQVARIAGDAALQSAIDAEQASRIAADSDAGVALANEAVARANGDSDTLASAKAYADTQKGNTDISIGLINDKDSDQDVAIAANAQAISDEVAARGVADAQLQSAVDANAQAISNEQSARSVADSALQVAIDVVDDKVEAILGTSPETLDTLQEIVAAFEGVDSGLQDVISQNGVRLGTAESKVETLEQSMLARIAEIGSIEVDLGDEEAARIAADSAAGVALANEATTRASADAALQSQIDGLGNDVSNLPIESGDSATLVSAKAYTDQEVSAVELSLQSEISTGDSALNSALLTEIQNRKDADSDLNDAILALPIESGDSATLVSAKAYTDQEVLSLSQDVSAGDSALNARIDAIISNTDSVALNSLAELVTEFQNADNGLSSMISSNNTLLNSLQGTANDHGSRIGDNEVTLADHEGRIITLEASDSANGEAIAKLNGGLCIEFDAVSGTIAIDEAEVRSQLVTHDADNLGGNTPDHYRINVYNVAGTMVN